MERRLVRDWIKRSLYLQGKGYFSVQDCVYSPPAPLRFRELLGKASYIAKLNELYTARAEAFLTPVEIFRPWYSRAIGRYLMSQVEASHMDAQSRLPIIEVGGGNGTNALHILDYIKESSPRLYDKVEYTLIEISAEMAERQRLRVKQHGSKVNVINQDFCEWDGPVEQDKCFVVALEVFDNLPHDKIVRTLPIDDQPWWIFDRSRAQDWQQVMVVSKGDNSHMEELEPLSDPLILRTAELFLQDYHATPEKEEPDRAAASLGDRIAKWARESLAKSRKSLEEGSESARSVFVPTGLVKFLDVLKNKFPQHQLIAADFDHLPAPDVSILAPWTKRGEPGSLFGCRNAPIVASKNEKGQTEDHTSYLAPKMGTADVFFQTDFEALQSVYLSQLARPAQCLRSRVFLEQYSDYTYTQTRSGYNPMLEDYHNTQFILS